ncbi:MAG: ribosome biogenesis GTPase Der, partial [Candidatus Syntrophonatronum acetioxidans]
KVHWLNRTFTLIDTGGIIMESRDKIEESIKNQARLAIEGADLILLVVDARQGLTSLDVEVAEMLRKTKKPVLVVANKVDEGKLEGQAVDFYSLGLGEPFPVSAAHGLNTGDLLDYIVESLPEITPEEEELEEEIMKVAVAGRPNVGKSSLINRLLDEERMIVTDIPGTTRDSVDSFLEREGDKFLFMDTAGIRRKSRVKAPVEYYSVLRSFRAMERADVVILLLDAREMVTDQDKRIAGFAHEKGKGIIIAVNKWDLVEKEDKTYNRYKDKVRQELVFLDYAPLLFISARTGQRVLKLLDLIKVVFENSSRRIPTGILNSLIREAVGVSPPPTIKGKALKIYYITQTGEKPPTFIIFVNNPELLHFSYKRYLENQLREAFDFQGTPVRIITRKR